MKDEIIEFIEVVLILGWASEVFGCLLTGILLLVMPFMTPTGFKFGELSPTALIVGLVLLAAGIIQLKIAEKYTK